MDQKPQRLESRGCCEQSINLPVVELFAYQSTPVHGIRIITLMDVDPPCTDDIPLIYHGLLPVDIVVDFLLTQASNFLPPGLNDFPGVEPHSGQIIPGQ